MELASMSFDFPQIFDSLTTKSPYSLYSSAGKLSPDGSFNADEAHGNAFLDSILKDDKSDFVSHAKRFLHGEDADSQQIEALKLLTTCCSYDSLNCASSIINGELGTVPYINDVAIDTGLSPLHMAALSNAPRCLAMLLKRRARTDLKTKDGRSLLPLELSLCNASMDVTWNPSSDSIGDLILLLGDKDLTVVKLLAEKTKEVDAVAYAYARAGAILPLTALLIVAIDKIREATVATIQNNDSVSQPEKTTMTIYESVIREAICSNSSGSQKRISLLREIELLQLFDAAVFSEFLDKKASAFITVVQAGDEAVLELLINTNNIDVNETDAEGNTVLQCSLKGSSVPHQQQTRIMNLLITHGARVSQRNKLGLSAVHFAAANANLSALEILLRANPELVHAKTVIKETPLFFAVKNNHLDCVELLLRWGASTEIHNLRKQRPIELTQSQDIRFLLIPTNISCFRKEPPELAQLHGEETGVSMTPPWLKKFVKWFPRYLQDTLDNCSATEYPLSSLKADFRSVFKMDLDHSSIGFSKLRDFVKSFPKLCQMKPVHKGKSGPATHWVILPTSSYKHGRPPERLIVDNSHSISPKKPEADLKLVQEPHVPTTLKAEPKPGCNLVVSYSKLKHPVLETLVRIRNSTSIFFLREFDFYRSYEMCLKEGMCFCCKKRMFLWANFPCRHKLWCSECKQEVTRSDDDHHRCVVCDAKVERFVLSPPPGFHHRRLSCGLPSQL